MTEQIVETQKMKTQAENLDHAVAEVFQLMMGVPCDPATPRPPLEAKAASVTAIVGLAGGLSGACVLRMQVSAALKLAELMTGAPMGAFDRTVKDALGEACNMLAGTWKGKLAGFSSSCMLSVPSVISGSSYEIHLPKPAFHLEKSYAFGSEIFTFCIACLGL